LILLLEKTCSTHNQSSDTAGAYNKNCPSKVYYNNHKNETNPSTYPHHPLFTEKPDEVVSTLADVPVERDGDADRDACSLKMGLSV